MKSFDWQVFGLLMVSAATALLATWKLFELVQLVITMIFGY